MPTAVQYILERNADPANPLPKINLAGLQVGNAWTNAYFDNTGAVDMWLGHNVVDEATHDGLIAACNMSGTGPLFKDSAAAAAAAASLGVVPGALGFTPLLDALAAPVVHANLTCNDWQNQAFAMMGAIDIYDAYSDVCVAAGAGASVPALPRINEADSNVNAGCAIEYDPCIDDKTAIYLNTPAVQRAINVVSPSLIPSGKWVSCSQVCGCGLAGK